MYQSTAMFSFSSPLRFCRTLNAASAANGSHWGYCLRDATGRCPLLLRARPQRTGSSPPSPFSGPWCDGPFSAGSRVERFGAESIGQRRSSTRMDGGPGLDFQSWEPPEPPAAFGFPVWFRNYLQVYENKYRGVGVLIKSLLGGGTDRTGS